MCPSVWSRLGPAQSVSPWRMSGSDAKLVTFAAAWGVSLPDFQGNCSEAEFQRAQGTSFAQETPLCFLGDKVLTEGRAHDNFFLVS